MVIFAGAVDTVQRGLGRVAGPTGVALPPPVNSTMRVGVGSVAGELAVGAARVSAPPTSANAGRIRISRILAPPGARPDALLIWRRWPAA